MKKREVGKVFVNAERYLELSGVFMMEHFYKNISQFLAIFAKSFIIDVGLGSKYASEKTETFKMKFNQRFLVCL